VIIALFHSQRRFLAQNQVNPEAFSGIIRACIDNAK